MYHAPLGRRAEELSIGHCSWHADPAVHSGGGIAVFPISQHTAALSPCGRPFDGHRHAARRERSQRLQRSGRSARRRDITVVRRPARDGDFAGPQCGRSVGQSIFIVCCFTSIAGESAARPDWRADGIVRRSSTARGYPGRADGATSPRRTEAPGRPSSWQAIADERDGRAPSAARAMRISLAASWGSWTAATAAWRTLKLDFAPTTTWSAPSTSGVSPASRTSKRCCLGCRRFDHHPRRADRLLQGELHRRAVEQNGLHARGDGQFRPNPPGHGRRHFQQHLFARRGGSGSARRGG